MADVKMVVPGINIFKCICKNGSVPIPITMRLMARLRCGERVVVTGQCSDKGHYQKYTIAAWPPFPLRRETR